MQLEQRIHLLEHLVNFRIPQELLVLVLEEILLKEVGNLLEEEGQSLLEEEELHLLLQESLQREQHHLGEQNLLLLED
jgi:hypothetical protein